MITPEGLEQLKILKAMQEQNDMSGQERLSQAFTGAYPQYERKEVRQRIPLSETEKPLVTRPKTVIERDPITGRTVAIDYVYDYVDDFGFVISEGEEGVKCALCPHLISTASTVDGCAVGTCDKRPICFKCAKSWSPIGLSKDDQKSDPLYFCPRHYRRMMILNGLRWSGKKIWDLLNSDEELFNKKTTW